ncbi:MAG: CHASE2 domain-containing protein [Cyanobacteria bacterium J06628_6]
MSQVYQVGGTLAQSAVSYVERQADTELLTGLRNGEFCCVFNARQMGKSSLLVRTAYHLRAAGHKCAMVDFSRIGSDQLTPLQWYTSFVIELSRSLGSPAALDDWLTIDETRHSCLQHLSAFVEDGLLPLCADRQIVIFLDEVDSLWHLPFSLDDFFAWIRGCYNQRAINPLYRQLTFALFGVVTIGDLIRDPLRTPFNIGLKVSLADLHRTEATPLLLGLQANPLPWPLEAVLDEILWWTGGQPLLTQKLCWLVSQQTTLPTDEGVADWVAALVRSHIIHHWQSQDTPEHFRTIRDRLLADEHQASRLLTLYQQSLEGEVSADDSREQTMLRLSGLVVVREGQLRVKCPLYRQIFSPDWVCSELAKLRPYALAYAQWRASGQTDDRCLLQGLALQGALAWAYDKNLSDADYRFLSVSQTYAQQQTEQVLKREQQARESAQHTLQSAQAARRKLNQARQKARQRPLPRPTLWLTVVPLAIASLIMALRLTGLLQFSEWLALDALFQQRAQAVPHPVVTVIGITEADLRRMGTFPLTDTTLATALQRIQQASPAWIGLDIYRDFPVEPGHAERVQALSTQPNVIGIYKAIAPTVMPPPELPAAQLGFADQVIDGDGKVRRALLSIAADPAVRYSFALQLALAYLQQRGIVPQSGEGALQLGQTRLRPFQPNDGAYVQADGGGYQILLNYYGNQAQFSTFSLQALLAGRVPTEALRDRIVLLGYTAESVNDFFQTPYSTQLLRSHERMSGVVLQANIVSMLVSAALSGRPLLQVGSPLAEYGWIVLCTGLGTLIGWRLQMPGRVILAILLVFALLWGLAWVSFLQGWWIPLVPACLGLAIAAALFPSLTDRVLFSSRLHQTVVYLDQLTTHQPLVFSLGLAYLKQAEGRRHEAAIDRMAEQLLGHRDPPANGPLSGADKAVQ